MTTDTTACLFEPEALALKKREISFESLTIGRDHIGAGASKIVYRRVIGDKEVAVGEYQKLTQADIREIHLLADLKHPNIVEFVGFAVRHDAHKKTLLLVTELCSRSLSKHVRAAPPPPRRDLFQMMLSIAEGVDYLHNSLQKPVVHLDIKAGNILVTSGNIAKITDFGAARQLPLDLVPSKPAGTWNWMAPEMFTRPPAYSQRCDIFSLGMVFWEMLAWCEGHPQYPWEGLKGEQIVMKVGLNNERPPVDDFEQACGTEIIGLVQKMWQQDPDLRPDISEVKETLATLVAEHS
ncbi:kinase-like domain-containing protein [Flagelloscypha sp. PMI_526]|nr:kinase-like domain-containing protein [Flagelloscypha sp. PMI_526]